jgi:archaellum biogenesis ATPase FlaH
MHWTESVIANLDNIWVPHRNFELAKADLFSAALVGPGQVILVEGPTRAGKSTLVEKFVAELCGKVGRDDRYMPIVSVTAENNSTNGEFSSKAFTLAALQAVRHPIFSLDESDFDLKRLRMIRETSEGTLREALEQALKLRRTAYFVVDEAQHIAHIKGGVKAAGKFLDSLKCLASRTGVRLIPVGTYQLTPQMQLSTHLLGRTTRIHIPRYRADVREDVIAFDQILAAYSLHLRFEPGTSLRSWNEYLYHGSLGCMGLLKAWLRDALRKALLIRHPTLRLRHFELSKRSNADLACIMREIKDGEALAQVQLSPVEKVDGPGEPSKPTRKPKARPFRAKARRFPVKASGVRL